MQGSGGRSHEIPCWLCAIVLAHFLGCASPSPKPEAPLPPSRRMPAVRQSAPAAPNPPAAIQDPASPGSGILPSVAPKSGPTPAQDSPEVLKSHPVKTPAKEQFHVHVVKWSGETLSAVAAWYTGEARNWKALAEASPEINPNLIREGNKILIPEALLKNREPMPRDFLDRLYSKSRKDKPRSKGQPAPVVQEGEMQLFGPKKSPTK